MNIVHHLAISASDLRRSERFYDAVLSPAGFIKVLSEEEICGWESRGFELLVYAADKKLCGKVHQIYQPGFHHLALRMTSRSEIEAIAEEASSLGTTILEGPKDFPQYPGNYFAVFMLDPDGLKIEFMTM